MAISTAKSGGTSFLRRQGEIGGAAALIGLSLFLGIACATWNVGDPSFSQSNQNAVENWMGSSGAAAADLLMQIFGLGATLAVALPAVWGLVLLSGRTVDHVWRRAWYAVGGIVLASAAMGCFTAPAGWPLPIGLGGVAGDLVLKLPAAVIGGFPSGFFGMIVAALLAVPALFLYLNGTALIGRPRPRFEDEDGRLPVAEDEGDESEGRFALAAGFVAHLVYSARSALARKVGETVQRRRQPEFGDGFREWQDEGHAPSAAQRVAPAMPVMAAAPAARSIRVAGAPAASAYVDPLAGYEPDEAYEDMPARTYAPVETPAPQPATVAYHRTMPNRVPIPVPGQAPLQTPRQAAAKAPVEAPASIHAPAPSRATPTLRQEPVMGVDPTARREPTFGDESAFDRAPEPRLSRDTSFSAEARPAAMSRAPQPRTETARREPEMQGGRAMAEPAFDEPRYDEAAWRDEADWQDADHGAARPFAPQDEDMRYDDEAAYDEPALPARAAHMAAHDDPYRHDEDAAFEVDDAGDPMLSVDEEMMIESEMRLEAADRVAGAAEPEPETAGGWRGLAANIVAFPGRRGGAAPARVEPEVAPSRQMAPSPRAPLAPAAQGGQQAPSARVVPQAQVSSHVTAEQQRLRTGSGRAVALQPATHVVDPQRFELPSVEFLTPPKPRAKDSMLSPEVLQENARLLEGVLEDFGVKGEIIEVRPGPVVTLYELEPAPGIKSSRVIGLADDIARSMSAIAARVAVIPGKNAIGIELPNQRRETVYFREMIGSEVFAQNKGKLALALGKTIGGEPVIADLAKMPHLLVAGTTGSGKSVSINTMILSLLYRMTPAECRLIMIDPKMLELSIYDGIPHLLAPVVTDPKKAVVALKWTVREMEDRYRKMSKVGVRNIDGFNQRVSAAMERGETMSRTVQTGFDRETGEPIFETEEFDLRPLPYIVVIIDEMADLMMVAGKDIEGAVQRLAQMARAAGIHVIMATQRPSVDVITGTIKANFPTRISFQVTSKIDSRTILGEQGAEQLLGMGDMLFMAGGGRTQRVHGPFVDDAEVEEIVKHLKAQGAPDYLDAILVDEDEDGGEGGGAGAGASAAAAGEGEAGDLYDQAVAVVLRDGKASTSYVQRRLGIGYNRAASIIERMEKEGIVGPANHAGKREILVPTEDDRM